MKLSKSIIKKYGITKKAWAVQRSQSGSAGRSSNIKKRIQVVHMAKKRKSFGSSTSGMMRAPIATSGMVGEALKGVGAAAVMSQYGQSINIPYKYPIAGYLVGGVPGAIAAWFISGASGQGTSAGGIVLN